jgi:c-di-GMP-binding flagellar brake protein YcgR
MDRRKGARFTTTSLPPVQVSFSGEAEGTGTLYDISQGGCKIDSSVTPALGASLTLRLEIFNQGDPLIIDTGIVGWTIKNKYFGVKFSEIKPSAQQVLNRYLAALYK